MKHLKGPRYKRPVRGIYKAIRGRTALNTICKITPGSLLADRVALDDLEAIIREEIYASFLCQWQDVRKHRFVAISHKEVSILAQRIARRFVEGSGG